MIQRIQTLWLFLAGLTVFGLFLFPYVNYIDLQIDVVGKYGTVDNEIQKIDSHILQMLMTIVTGLLPIFIIFKYKQRKLQIKLCYLSIVMIVLLGIWMYSKAGKVLAETNQFLGAKNIGIGFFLLPFAILFIILAINGIIKDERLVKSVDRLR